MGNPAQANSPCWGGAQQGGRLEVSGSAAFAVRWMRIFSITPGVPDTGKSLPRERSECFGHDPHCPASGRAGLDIDAENPLQTLRLYALLGTGHRSTVLGRRGFLLILHRRMLVYPAPLGRRQPRAVFAVRCKHPVEAGEVGFNVRLAAGIRVQPARDLPTVSADNLAKGSITKVGCKLDGGSLLPCVFLLTPP